MVKVHRIKINKAQGKIFLLTNNSFSSLIGNAKDFLLDFTNSDFIFFSGSSNSSGLNYGNGGLGSSNGNVGGNLNGGSDGNGGRDNRENRSNYGPNSPPTGSLPPFYESLKSGNGSINGYNAANASFLAQNGYNNLMMVSN